MDVIAEAMASIDNILKTKGAGSQKLARGLVRGLNPNLVTRHTLRRVCHTFKDLYHLLEVSFFATLPDIALLEKDRLSKERLADYFRVKLCAYAGTCDSEAEEDCCTSAFGMQLYKNAGVQAIDDLYPTGDFPMEPTFDFLGGNMDITASKFYGVNFRA